MQDFIDEAARKLDGFNQLSYEEFDRLRRFREQIEDIEDRVLGLDRGVLESFSATRPTAASNGLAIVVGHTERAQGASATSPISQSEYVWNSDLANKIKSRCDQASIPSKIFFRDGIGISGAYQQVVQWGANCIVELHFNAFNGSAHGTETLYDEDTNSGSKAWAERLQSRMLDALNLRDRGLKERDPGQRGYASVSAANIPSALIEPFFGDSPTDAQAAHSGKDELAEAISGAAAAQLAGT